jgi:hypothetical protein
VTPEERARIIAEAMGALPSTRADLLEALIAGHIYNATENAFEVGRKFGRNEARK